jgi:iron complex transport system substrate-binding protein
MSAAFPHKRAAIAVSWLLGLAMLTLNAEAAERVVSMNPSLTRVLVALDATDRLVGVDDFSARTETEVSELPRVGGLFNPSLEAVVALRPDLVVLVPSLAQRDFRDRLVGLGVEVLELPNITLDQLLASILEIGARVDRVVAAQARVAEIRRVWEQVRARAPSERPGAVLVLTRDPLYVAGAGSWLDEMLRAAGMQNTAARYAEPYPRVSLEWLIAAAPDVIIDSADDPMPAAQYWAQWPSIPAVAASRVFDVPAGSVTLPGPFVDRSLSVMVDTIRPKAAAR